MDESGIDQGCLQKRVLLMTYMEKLFQGSIFDIQRGIKRGIKIVPKIVPIFNDNR